MEQQLQSNTEPTKIVCPHCNSNNCFAETEYMGNIPVESYLCVGCGYTSTTEHLDGSEFIKQFEQQTAELIKDLRWIDEKGLVWYPIVLNFPSFGIIFPDGTSKFEWGWRTAPAIEIPKEEQKNYPIPGQKDAFYEKRIDMKSGKLFANDKFNDACKFIGFIQD